MLKNTTTISAYTRGHETRLNDIKLNTIIHPQNCCDSVAYPQWLASTGRVLRVQEVPESKSGQDMMTSVPPSVFFHSSSQIRLRAYSA